MKRQAVFLDRDGVLNRSLVRDGRPFAPECLEDFKLVPGASEAVSRIQEEGYLSIVVTNQPDIATGKQTPAALAQMHEILRAALDVDDIFVCPHSSEDGCDCRKPRPGMLVAAGHKWDIDLSRSVMVGDRWRDVEAGKAVGCATVFIDYNYDESRPDGADYVSTSLADSLSFILKELRRRAAAADIN